MPVPAVTNLLVLENQQLTSVLRRNDIVTAFPFMRAAAEKVQPKKRGCVKCGRTAAKNKLTVADMNSLKMAIANLPPAKRDQLKNMLGVAQLRIYYRDSQGGQVKRTF